MTSSERFPVSPVTPPDMYGQAAEFYDLMSEQHWAQRKPLIAAALGECKPQAGPVVDVGAGTGLVVELIAQRLPTAQIVAVEPSAGMRAALATRLVCRSGLAQRTTIVAGMFDSVDLPPRFAGLCALGVLGHLTQAGRRSLFELLRSRLADSAPAVVDVFKETAPPLGVRLCIARRTVGDLRYETWSQGERGPDGSIHWMITYRVLRAAQVLREQPMLLQWSDVGLDTIREEAELTELAFRQLGPDLAVLYRR